MLTEARCEGIIGFDTLEKPDAAATDARTIIAAALENR